MDCDVTLLVGTCDAPAYRALWPLFDKCLKKYWKVDCPIIFAGETIEVPGYKTVLSQGAWGGRILKTLEAIKTEYVIFILEDYLFARDITNEFIKEQENILIRFKAEKVQFDQLYPSGVYDLQHLEKELFRFRRNSNYLNSCQPALIKTEYLKKILLPDCNPWGFELSLNERTSGFNPTIILNNTGRIYFNAMRVGGNLEVGAQEFFEKENLEYKLC